MADIPPLQLDRRIGQLRTVNSGLQILIVVLQWVIVTLLIAGALRGFLGATLLRYTPIQGPLSPRRYVGLLLASGVLALPAVLGFRLVF
jgi:hypothetical protein